MKTQILYLWSSVVITLLLPLSLQANVSCPSGQTPYEITIDAGTFPAEISWSLTNSITGDTAAVAFCGTSPSGISSDTVCLDDGVNYCMFSYDDWGDGWNGGSYTITDLNIGAIVVSGTPNNGLPGDGSAGCDGSVLEDAYCLTVGIIAGCTDSNAVNFNPFANTDDGSCTFAPANDLCSNAITVNCGDTISGTTIAASNDTSLNTCGTDLTTAGGVWYVFAGDGSPVTASLCGSGYDTKIGVFSGICDTLLCITGNDDDCGLQSRVTFTSVMGSNYYIYVTGFGTNTGDFDLSISCDILGCTDPAALNFDPMATLDDGSCEFPPANDSCANAIMVACGDTINGSTVGASPEVGSAFSFCGTAISTAPGVWYEFAGNGDTVTASLCSFANYDSKLAVFAGTCDSLTCITGNDDFCGTRSEVEFASMNGVTYYIYVSGFASAAGDFTLDISCSSTIATCDVPQNLMVNNLTSTSAMLNWDMVPGALAYEINADAVGVTPPGFVQVTTANSLLFSGLNPENAYYFTVRAICDTAGTFLSDFADSVTFTTPAVVVCEVPQNLQPINITDDEVTFTWNSVANAVAYNIIGNIVGGNPATEFNISDNDTFLTLSGLIADTSYWWSVRAICDLSGTNVSAFAENDTFSTLPFVCAVPQNLFADSLTDNCATLKWDAVPSAIGYNVAGNAVGGDPIDAFSINVTDTEFHLTGLNTGISYFWTVRTICDLSGTVSDFASNDTFTTTDPSVCAVPQNLFTDSISPSSALLTWDPAPGSIFYSIIGNEVGGLPQNNFSVIENNNQYLLTGLIPGKTYWWTVKNVCDFSGTISDFAPNDTFTTPTILCTEPVLTPAQNITSSSALLQWDGDALSFQVIGSKLGDPTVTFMTSSKQLQVSNLLPNTGYFWQVASICGDSLIVSSVTDTFFTMPFCQPPTNVQTINIGEDSAVFSWTPSPNALGYRIAAAEVPVNSNDIFFTTVLAPASSYTLKNLMPGTDYKWRIVGQCGYESSPFSQIVDFTTASPTAGCEVPMNLFSDSITDNSATLNWDAVPGAIAYRVKGNAVGGDPITDFLVLIPSGATTEYLLTGLNLGVSYFWTVRAICDPVDPNMVSAFADPDTFTTNTLKQPHTISAATHASIDLFPNPVIDKLYLQVPEPLENLTIKDINGKQWLNQQQHATSGNTVEINTSNLPSGVYVIRLEFEGHELMRRFVVTRN